MSKVENKIKGGIGEDFACKFLQKNNYEILERNYISYRGEIDIIALKNNTIIFIEVKTRTQDMCGMPSEAVNKHKKKQLYKVAEYYLYANNLQDVNVRFDVIEVYLHADETFALNHIKDAIWDSPFSLP